MTTEIATFTCSICGEPSTEICVFCTKDACANHLCERCKRCSDCCECEVHLNAEEPYHAFEPHVAPPEPEPLPAIEPEFPAPFETFGSAEPAAADELETPPHDFPPAGFGE